MTGPRTSPRPLLLGHRGARALKSIPENTLASFDRALADGCDGFEFDVRLSAGGTAVVCHDAQTGNFEIASASAEQLSALPQLRDVLARYQDSYRGRVGAVSTSPRICGVFISAGSHRGLACRGPRDSSGPDLRDEG